MKQIWNKLKSALTVSRNGRLMGTDPYGNRYFERLGAHAGGRSRRLVILNGLKSAEDMSPHHYDENALPGILSS